MDYKTEIEDRVLQRLDRDTSPHAPSLCFKRIVLFGGSPKHDTLILTVVPSPSIVIIFSHPAVVSLEFRGRNLQTTRTFVAMLHYAGGELLFIIFLHSLSMIWLLDSNKWSTSAVTPGDESPWVLTNRADLQPTRELYNVFKMEVMRALLIRRSVVQQKHWISSSSAAPSLTSYLLSTKNRSISSSDSLWRMWVHTQRKLKVSGSCGYIYEWFSHL